MQMFAHSPANIVRQLLVDKGVGTVTDEWPVRHSIEMDSPDNTITVYNTTEKDFGTEMVQGEHQFDPGVQIRVRGENNDTAFLKADEVHAMLTLDCDSVVVTIDDAQYAVDCVSDVSYPRDMYANMPTSRRNVFVINAVVPVRML